MKLSKLLLALTMTAICAASVIAGVNTNSSNRTIINGDRADSPSTALSEFFYALIKKDVARFKKRLTNETLKMIEEAAEEKNISVDETLKEFLDTNPMGVERRPVMQKQKLNGDKCTIEAYINGKWEVVPLVKQDEIWRVDFMAMG